VQQEHGCAPDEVDDGGPAGQCGIERAASVDEHFEEKARAQAAAGITVKQVAVLDFTKFDDRPVKGAGKHATWIGDWNGDGKPEYFVVTKKGGTSTLFYSSGNGYKPTKHWYMPSYSVITLDVRGDSRPEYLLKTSKIDRDDLKGGVSGSDFVDWDGDPGGSMTVFKIPEDPISKPLVPVMRFPRSVPIVSGMHDVDGDGFKDLLITEHTNKAEFVARYYKGKSDRDGKPFESNYRWTSDGAGTSMAGNGHKARWGDIQVISPSVQRLYAAGAEDTDNNVIYWRYDKARDTFDARATIFDLKETAAARNNELNLTTVRAMSGSLMFGGKDGAFLFVRRNGSGNGYGPSAGGNVDSYVYKKVPGIDRRFEYPEFWCLPSQRKGSTNVVTAILRKRGGSPSVIEFRVFDTVKGALSNVVKEVTLPGSQAQRIDVLRDDNSFDVNRPVKQFIVAHQDGASVYDVRIDI
jgi:hypothetical protein